MNRTTPRQRRRLKFGNKFDVVFFRERLGCCLLLFIELVEFFVYRVHSRLITIHDFAKLLLDVIVGPEFVEESASSRPASWWSSSAIAPPN